MPALSRAQSRLVDKLAVDHFAIPSIILMENAARAVADVATGMLSEPIQKAGSSPILILCGGGNNGGDGLAAARHLHNRGCGVSIVLTSDPGRYHGDALINWKIVQAMGLPVAPWNDKPMAGPALLIDAIFGTGLDKPPRDPFADIVQWVEQLGAPVLAVDIPSGLDCDAGKPLGACIRATRTVTLVTEKPGFANPDAKQYLGEVVIGTIGAPREIIEMVLSSSTR